MKCNKCNFDLQEGDKFCQKCGNNINTLNIQRNPKPMTSSIISFITFMLAYLIILFCFIVYIKSNSGAAFWVFFFAFLFSGVPLVISIVLSIISLSEIRVDEKNGLKISKKRKIFKYINIFQIPVLIISIIILSSINSVVKDKSDEVKEMVTNLYGQNEIIGRSSCSDEGGTNEQCFLVKINNYKYPIVATYDLENDEFYDNMIDLKSADDLNYDTYISNLFNNKVISLMTETKYSEYKYRDITIIIEANELQNDSLLKGKLYSLAEKYNASDITQLTLNLVFVDEFKNDYMEDYYNLAAIKNAGINSCIEGLEKEYRYLYKDSSDILLSPDKYKIRIDNNVDGFKQLFNN